MLITNTLQLKSGLMKKLCLIAGVLPPPSASRTYGRTRAIFRAHGAPPGEADEGGIVRELFHVYGRVGRLEKRPSLGGSDGESRHFLMEPQYVVVHSLIRVRVVHAYCGCVDSLRLRAFPCRSLAATAFRASPRRLRTGCCEAPTSHARKRPANAHYRLLSSGPADCTFYHVLSGGEGSPGVYRRSSPALAFGGFILSAERAGDTERGGNLPGWRDARQRIRVRARYPHQTP